MADNQIKPLAPLGPPIRTMLDLQMALRARCDALEVCFDSIDEESCFPARYAGKILGPRPTKSLGAQSLPAILACLGVQLALIERPDALASYTPRLAKRQRGAGEPLLAGENRRRKRNPRIGNSHWGEMMRRIQIMVTNPKQRSAVARAAANARWSATRKLDQAAKATAEYSATRRPGNGNGKVR
jgi:hypothetical protein